MSSKRNKRITLLKLERRVRYLEKRTRQLEDYAEWSKRRRKALQDYWDEPLYPEPVFTPAESKGSWFTAIKHTLKEMFIKKGNK